ncbi:SDR family NAD(P)-dependent oxidoreductase [Paenibacillus flagellatus]|uniref:3-ketoacyl-ACP reductase n=1 Tax=Paenibacillus flagellatus TaxID=2211139 RepID=A0A2V5KVX2_9BACL|nr:SDR family oxidoreductase [Paenibacillus flagellatus]PYI53746.1 3-ketoacyl-ACP reductase [Paenibacillus flagellatus]
MDYGLNGKAVLVTGGSRGIGKAAARLFASEGARVFITYASGRERAEMLVDEIGRAGGACRALRMSLDDPQSITDAMERVEREANRLDVLVNNAVYWGEEAPIEDSTDASWFSVIDQTVKGTYLVTKAAVPLMKRGGWGRIVHLSSSLVREGKPDASANIAGKAALHGLSRSLAAELAPSGIYSNVVIPELTLSEWVANAFPPDVLEQYARSFPTRRLAEPEDVAHLIVYLCSTANRFVNGEEIRVTGGK